MEDKEFKIKAYTLKELARLYDTPLKTFRQWVKRIQPTIGPRIGHYYNPRQVHLMRDHFGPWCTGIVAFFANAFVNTSDAFGRTFIKDYDKTVDYNQRQTNDDASVADSADAAAAFDLLTFFSTFLVFISMPVALYKLVRLWQQPAVREGFLTNESRAYIRYQASHRRLLTTFCVSVIVGGCMTIGYGGYLVGLMIF